MPEVFVTLPPAPHRPIADPLISAACHHVISHSKAEHTGQPAKSAEPTLLSIASRSNDFGRANIIDSVVGFMISRLLSARLRPEPFLLLGDPFPSVLPLRRMKKPPAPTSRRRSQRPLGRKTFVYLADQERDLVDEAASLERRSVSSFIANAAVEAAERVVTQRRSNKR